MKKLFYFLIALMFISVIPEIASAQSNDPFEQKTLKASGKSGGKEQKVNRRKETAQPAKPAAKEDKTEHLIFRFFLSFRTLLLSPPPDRFLACINFPTPRATLYKFPPHLSSLYKFSLIFGYI